MPENLVFGKTCAAPHNKTMRKLFNIFVLLCLAGVPAVARGTPCHMAQMQMQMMQMRGEQPCHHAAMAATAEKQTMVIADCLQLDNVLGTAVAEQPQPQLMHIMVPVMVAFAAPDTAWAALPNERAPPNFEQRANTPPSSRLLTTQRLRI